jgi:hypothetical protein
MLLGFCDMQQRHVILRQFRVNRVSSCHVVRANQSREGELNVLTS